MIFVQPSLHNKFFMTSIPPKFKPKFIQQTSQITNIAKTSQFQCSQIQAKVHPTNITNYQHCQNFMTSMIPKSKPKLIQQHHKLPTLPKFHKPPTLSRLHHDQKIQHFKNAHNPTLQHDQSYNAPNSNKIT